MTRTRALGLDLRQRGPVARLPALRGGQVALVLLHYAAGDNVAGPPPMVTALWAACVAALFVVVPLRHGGRTIGQRMAGIAFLETRTLRQASEVACVARSLLLRAAPFAVFPVRTLPGYTDLYALALMAAHYLPAVVGGIPRGAVDILLGTTPASAPEIKPRQTEPGC